MAGRRSGGNASPATRNQFSTCRLRFQREEVVHSPSTSTQSHGRVRRFRYVQSALIYATSDSSFEDVTLKFFALRDREPLREYLQAVLQLQRPATVTNRSLDFPSNFDFRSGQNSNHYFNTLVDRFIPQRVGRTSSSVAQCQRNGKSNAKDHR